MPDVENIVRNLVQPIMPDYKMEGIGHWANPSGTVLHYVVRHRNLEAVAADWNGFHADSRWKAGWKKRKSKEPIVTHVETIPLVGLSGLPPK